MNECINYLKSFEMSSSSSSVPVVTGVDLGEFTIYVCENQLEGSQQKREKCVMVSVIDNSGSMGNATRESATVFSQMYDLKNIDLLPGALILFSSDAKIFSSNIRSSTEVRCANFPQQGQTNITAGICLAINYICSHQQQHAGESIHYLMTFLSDGGHNCGFVLDSYELDNLRKSIDKLRIRLSIIVVGIINPDTSLGMRVKTSLETVQMPQLESFYYAHYNHEMQRVLQQVLDGCSKNLGSGHSINLQVKDGIFLENMKTSTECYLSGSDRTYIAVKNTGKTPTLLIDGVQINPTIRLPIISDITYVIDSMTPKLSQKNIADGPESIRNNVKLLDTMIDYAESFFNNLALGSKVEKSYVGDDIGKVVIDPSSRLRMIKKLNKVKNEFQTERNKLKSLLVTIENNSAKQAEYLTGINKKYASKAINRAETLQITPEQILTQMVKLGEKMKVSLDSRSGLVDLASSLLSLNTPVEQYAEWITIGDKSLSDFQNVYAFLVYCGFPAYPVKFQHNNAVQMDPFQTYCLEIEPYLVDTSSIMLANQLNYNKLLSPSGRSISDTLILISPQCPQASLLAMKSLIYQYNCSITLCRDLYMYHPKMTFSLHAHSLIKATDEYYQNKSSAYLKLALNIVYSIRKFWGSFESSNENNVALLKHWVEDWETITQSEGDACNHPVQLLLLFGASDLPASLNTIDPDSYMIPLLNLFNEVLARTMKIRLAYLATDEKTTSVVAIGLMQNLLGIGKAQCPQPDPDVMKAEPSNDEVRESCQWIKLEVKNDDILEKLNMKTDLVTFVDQTLRPYYRTYELCFAIHSYLVEKKINWDQLIVEIEKIGEFPDELVNYIQTRLILTMKKTAYDYIKTENHQHVALTMFLQATLNHDSQSRFEIDQQSVLESQTFRKMSVDLMMEFYSEACKTKRQEYMSIIGDVTYGGALIATPDQFNDMLGSHTHGWCKNKFWALLKASKGDYKKREFFMRKSGQSVHTCYSRI
jgi:hypothetical protein